MKAYIYKEYGAPEVLKVTNINIPIPKDNELLIKVIAVAVTTGDVRFRKADPFLIRFMNGLSTPNKQILGMHISGSVEKIGKAVTKFKKGDKIYGSLEMSFGAYAEYVCIPENNPIELKPENYSFSEAAAIIFGATTAHHFLKHGGIKVDEEVLINGATGAVGIAAVQFAKYYGTNVTAVCSKRNFDLVKQLGADHCIDYKVEDFTQKNKKYDIIYDTIGTLNFYKVRESLTETGRFVTNAAQGKDYFAKIFNYKKVILGVSSDADLETINKLVEEGVLKSVIDTTYSFDQMREAHARTDSGRKVGNVVVNMLSAGE